MAGAGAGHGLSGGANCVQNGPSVFALGPAMTAPSAISRSKTSVSCSPQAVSYMGRCIAGTCRPMEQGR